MARLLIIGDVHGRDFWEEPCKHIDEFDKVIFLGDYHDPYPFQVSKETSRHQLRDKLVPFVEANRDKVVCLFGNHDGNYLVGAMADRFDHAHRDEIRSLLQRMNLQLTYEQDGYLFSHSGVLPGWVDENIEFGEEETMLEVVRRLNDLPFTDKSLLEVSSYRGGDANYGSCVWGDVREYADAYQFKDWYQIFGHTQLEREIIMPTFACLDCRKAFILDTETKELKAYEQERIHESD